MDAHRLDQTTIIYIIYVNELDYQVAESLMFVGFWGCFVTYSVLLLRNRQKRMSVFLEESNSLSFEAYTVDGKALDKKVDSN